MNKPSKRWLQSVKKCEKIVKKAEEEKLNDRLLKSKCGFCEEYQTSSSATSILYAGCFKCPLFKESICKDIHKFKVTYWQINDELERKERNWKKIQKWCKKMLEAIKRNKF